MNDLNYQVSEPPENHRTIVLVCYILGGVGVLTGFFLSLIALIICYIKRGESNNTIYYSHYDWLISTFWIGLFWTIVSALTMFFFGLGWLIYMVLSIWLLYRFIKGLLRFVDHKAVV